MTINSWIQNAEEIRFGGRWRAVNEAIVHFNAEPGRWAAWQVDVFASLCGACFSEYLNMRDDYARRTRDDVRLLAWRARNLLELSVWAVFSTRSPNDLRRIYEDAGRDVRDIFAAFVKWGDAVGQPSDWGRQFVDATSVLEHKAGLAGVDTLGGAYKRVSQAAEECGIGEHFKIGHKLLSKFAHPTAMQIMAERSDSADEQFREAFFGQGCLFFIASFETLEAFLREP